MLRRCKGESHRVAANAEVAFVVTNSTVANTDLVQVAIVSGATAASDYQISVAAIGSGSFTIALANLGASSRSDTLVIRFMVFKGVSA